MKYRDTLLTKLNRVDTLTNKIIHYLNIGDRTSVYQTVQELKEINQDIVSYIEREPLSAEELAIKS